MTKNPLERLRHMRDFAAEAVQFAQGRSRADLDSDRLFSLAVARLFAVMGEAATHVPDDLRDAHPEIPWRSIVGMRNRLIHGYVEVDHDIVWETIVRHLPPLITALDQMLTEP